MNVVMNDIVWDEKHFTQSIHKKLYGNNEFQWILFSIRKKKKKISIFIRTVGAIDNALLVSSNDFHPFVIFIYLQEKVMWKYSIMVGSLLPYIKMNRIL